MPTNSAHPTKPPRRLGVLNARCSLVQKLHLPKDWRLSANCSNCASRVRMPKKELLPILKNAKELLPDDRGYKYHARWTGRGQAIIPVPQTGFPYYATM